MPDERERQDEAASTDYMPGSIPRNCVSCYRGYLAKKPKRISRRNGGMTVARMGVNMASSKSTSDEADELTEWVDITPSGVAELSLRLIGRARGRGRAAV